MGRLRAILFRDYDSERLPVIAEGTHDLHQFRGGTIFGTREHSNRLARLGNRNA